MKKFRFAFTNLLFWPIIALICLLVSHQAFLTNYPSKPFDSFTFVFLVAMILLMMIAYFAFEHKQNKIKFHQVFLPALTVIAIIFIANIWLQGTQVFESEITSLVIVVTPTIEEKIRFSIEVVIFLLGLYMMVYPFSRHNHKSTQMQWFRWSFVAFIFITIGFSIYLDFDLYKNLFTNNLDKITVGAQSIFRNENSYGYFLLLGMMVVMCINYYHRRIYNYLFMAIFYFDMIFTTCLTTLGIGAVLFFVYLIFDCIRSWRKHWILATIELSSIIVIGVGVFLTMVLLYKNGQEWVIALVKFVKENIFNKDFSTFSSRTMIWEYVYEELIAINPLSFMFGRGYGLSKALIEGVSRAESGYVSSYVSSTHNGLMEIFLTTGLFGLLLYASALIYLLVCLVYLMFKKQFGFAFTYLLMIGSIMTLSMMESHVLYGFSMSDIIMTLLFALPITNAARNTFNKKPITYFKEFKVVDKKLDIHLLTRLIASVIFGLVLVTGVLFTNSFIYQEKIQYILLYILIGLVIALVFVPYLITMFYKNASRIRFKVRVILWSLIEFDVLVVAFILPIVLDFNPITYPILILLSEFLSMFIVTLIYSLAVKGSIKDFFKDTILGVLANSGWAIIVTTMVSLMLNIIIPITYSNMSYIVLAMIFVASGFTYYLVLSLNCTPHSINYRYHFDRQRFVKMKKIVQNPLV